MIVQSRDGQGTLVMLEIPVLQQDSPGDSLYAARSSTRL